MNTMTASLKTQNITLQYGVHKIIDSLNISFQNPEIVSIIGPNGSGKSTLLKALCRLLIPCAGTVYLNGNDINSMKTESVAQIISVLPQSSHAPADITVEELVRFGRLPYQKFFDSLNEEDLTAVEESIKITGLDNLRERSINTLSGGERQRAWLAMALAQQPQILLLDEPTTYLDVHHQLELMELVVRLHYEKQLTVIMVLHDLNHAARYSQRLIAVKTGKIIADGKVSEVFTESIIEQLYDVKVLITTLKKEENYYPICFPYTVS